MKALQALKLALATTLAVWTLHRAHAAEPDYPARTVKLVVPSLAGGPLDAVSRLLARRLEARTGATFLVENKPGGNLQIASNYVAKSDPDGYTLMTTAAAHVINPLLYAKLAYDPLRDLSGVAMLTQVQVLIVVNAELPIRNLGELVAWAKAHPEQLRYATSGNGSGAHLAAELLSLHAGIKLAHIPYKGTAGALPDLIGGRIEMMMDTVQLLEPHIRSGKLRAIAFTGSRRSAAMPQVPTVAESGYPQVVANTWTAMVLPSRTPKAVVDKLAHLVGEVLAEEDTRRQIAAYGMEAATAMTPDEVNRYFEGETKRWGEVIKVGNIKVD